MLELDWWQIVALVILAPFVALCAAMLLFVLFMLLSPVWALWAVLLSLVVQPFHAETARSMRRWASGLMGNDGHYPEY